MSKNKRRSATDLSLHYKLEQLNKQVELAVVTALAASADAFLRELVCESVLPLRGGSCFQVSVRLGNELASTDDVLERLKRARGYFRSEIALSIHRKRTPELTFVIVGSDETGFV